MERKEEEKAIKLEVSYREPKGSLVIGCSFRLMAKRGEIVMVAASPGVYQDESIRLYIRGG